MTFSFINLFRNLISLTFVLIFNFNANSQEMEILTFPNTNVQIELPNVYETTSEGGLSGIVDLTGGTQFVVSSFMAPIGIIKSQLTPEAFAAKDVQITGNEDIQVDEKIGTLYTATQTQEDKTVQKLILLFGDEFTSNMVMVVYEEASSKDALISYLKSIKTS